MDNCIRIRSWSPFHFRVIFVDTKEYVSARVFANYGIKPRKIRKMVSKDTPFRLIVCSIRKKDGDRFVEALSKLRNSILLLGYKDYEEMCIELKNAIADSNNKLEANDEI